MARNTKGLKRGNNQGNSGGKKGRSGPRPKEWKLWCGDQLNDEKVRDAIVRSLVDEESRNHSAALKLMAETVHGKPAQELNLHHDGKLEVVWEQPE